MIPASAMAASGAGWVSRGHRAIAPFRLHRPTSVADAVAMLARAGPNALALAGGIDAIAALRDGAETGEVVSLGGIADLADVTSTADSLHIGACVTHRRMETDPAIAEARPDLAAAWRTIGNVRVRMAGTVGGNLLAGNPQYDAPVILTAAGAALVFASVDGERTIDLRGDAAEMQPVGALLTKVIVPLKGQMLLFDRSLKPAISVALSQTTGPDGAVRTRAAVGCAFAAPIAVELDLGATADPARAAAEFVDGLPEPVNDPIAGASYRRKMAGVLLRRLLARLEVGGDGR